MASEEHVDEFNHQIAIKLSRAANTLNPNDLLAQRVTDLAKQHNLEGFVKGAWLNYGILADQLMINDSCKDLWQVSRLVSK